MSASLGVIRFAESSMRHLSSRSTNERSSLSSSSFILYCAWADGRSRALRSRALNDDRILLVFCVDPIEGQEGRVRDRAKGNQSDSFRFRAGKGKGD